VEVDADFTVEITEEVDVTFGLEFRVPDNSYIMLDVVDPSNSSQHGFTKSTGLRINPTPFTANLSISSLSLSLALEPRIVFGASIAGNLVHADAGAFIDVPKLSLDINSVGHVDAECNPMNSTTSGPAIPPSLGNATNVVPSAEIDLGLEAGAGIGDIGPEAELTLVSGVWTLPTACLLWDQEGKTLAEATKVIAASSSASSASAASASSAAAASSSAAAASSSAAAVGAARRAGEPEVYIWTMIWGLGLSTLFGMVLL
jgi:hypothetical protein